MKHGVSLLKALTALLLAVCCLSGTAALAELSYFEKYEYANQLFGLTNASYTPHKPLFIEPFCTNRLNTITSGVREGKQYSVYAHYNEEKVSDYLAYLEFWGYTKSETKCAIPGVQSWKMISTADFGDAYPLLTYVDVFHEAENELMAVAYSYLDAFLMDEYGKNPTWNAYGTMQPSKLPAVLPLKENVKISLDDAFLTDSLFVVSEKSPLLQPHTLYNLDQLALEESTITIGGGMLRHYAIQREHHLSDSIYLCVKLSFDEKHYDLIRHSLRAAYADDLTAEDADCVTLPIMLLKNTGEDPLFYTLPDDEACSELWLVFPPNNLDNQETMRLYLRLQEEGTTWIGDLREWEYVNFVTR